MIASKRELLELGDSLLLGDDPEAVERCVAFVVVESVGFWHNRARAMLCRRLKHCRLADGQARRLVTAIAGRLVEGRFSEQFKDQLRLALQLDGAAIAGAAELARGSPREYVRRYAVWVLGRRSVVLCSGRERPG